MEAVIIGLCRGVVLAAILMPCLNYAVTAPSALSRFLVALIGLMASLLLTTGAFEPPTVLVLYAVALLYYFVLFRKPLAKDSE